MSNDIVKVESIRVPQAYDGDENPFSRYASEAGSRLFLGSILKFVKGDYLAGADAEAIPHGTKLVAIMNTLQVGFVKWEDSSPTESRMGLVTEGFRTPLRASLGNTDPTEWPLDDTGNPRDPWQRANHLVLVDPENHEIAYTFVTGSTGGINQVAELCHAYGKHWRQKPDDLPVISLECSSYMHRIKS